MYLRWSQYSEKGYYEKWRDGGTGSSSPVIQTLFEWKLNKIDLIIKQYFE
jgi:hypothetical protein